MRTLNLIFANLTEPGLSSFPVKYVPILFTLTSRELSPEQLFLGRDHAGVPSPVDSHTLMRARSYVLQ